MVWIRCDQGVLAEDVLTALWVCSIAIKSFMRGYPPAAKLLEETLACCLSLLSLHFNMNSEQLRMLHQGSNREAATSQEGSLPVLRCFFATS